MPTENKFYITLYQVYHNTLKMLIERGYQEDVDRNYSGDTFNEFKKKYKDNNLTVHVYKTDKDYSNNSDIKVQCICYFIRPDSRVGKVKQQFYRLMEDIKKTFDSTAGLVDLIFIADDKDQNPNMSSISKYVNLYQSELSPTKTQKYKLELFTFAEKSFNLPDHILVPKHKLIKDPEIIKKKIKEYKCRRDHIPKVFINDPVSRYYGAEQGNLFKIFRQSPSSGLEISYRIVV
jgi:DNA-directed RNA polymerase subunit H (RpoH/RPB5)